MRYYYLDHEKKPQGLYTRDELSSLLEKELITVDTLVACAGDSHWRKLSELLSESSVQCSTWNKNESSCPYCKQILTSDSHLCANCGRSMYCPRKGLFGTFFYVIKNSFNYKGRAGRREFWLFYLAYFVFYLCISWLDDYLSKPIVCDSDVISDSELLLSDISNHIMDSYSGFVFTSIYCLLMIFPFLAVSVRRLHDIGISALPVVIASFSYLIGTVSVFLFIFSLPNISLDTLNNMQTIDYKLFIYPFIVFVSYFCLFVTSIFLLVGMFIPGHAGNNHYGPAPLSK